MEINLKRPNKQERHDIYVSALNYYKAYITLFKGAYDERRHPYHLFECQPSGLCHAINHCDANIYDGYNKYDVYTRMNINFPELYKLKPNISEKFDYFWWSRENTDIRIKTLESVINSTRKKKNKSI